MQAEKDELPVNRTCGGCGATKEIQRCIGCLHYFGQGDEWVLKHHDPQEAVATATSKLAELQREVEEKAHQVETLLRGINESRQIIDPIWRERMGAESVREYVQRGHRCLDEAIRNCQFFAAIDRSLSGGEGGGNG